MPITLAELIALAPWCEAVTYRDTWPHEYVLSQTDDQQAFLAAICARFLDGAGVSCRFFTWQTPTCSSETISTGSCPTTTTLILTTTKTTKSSIAPASTGTGAILEFSWEFPGETGHFSYESGVQTRRVY